MANWRRNNNVIEIEEEDSIWVFFSEDFGISRIIVDTLTGKHSIEVYVHSQKGGKNSAVIDRESITKTRVMDTLYSLGLSILDIPDSIMLAQQILLESESNATHVFEHRVLGFANGAFFLDKPIGLSGPRAASTYCSPALVPCGTLVDYILGLDQHILGHPTLELALAIGALGPIAYLLHQANTITSFPLVAFIGNSSSGKTTSLKLACSLWGLPTTGIGLIDSLHQTENALYATLEKNQGMPAFIDETSAGGTAWDFAQMIYFLSEGRGKKRCDVQGDLRRTAKFGSAVIFTGERSLLEHTEKNPGLYARLLELTFPAWTDNAKHAEDITAFVTANYGTAAPVFMEWLLANKSILPDMFHQEYNGLQNLCPPCSGIEHRLLKIAAQILASAQVLNISLGITLDIEKMRQLLITQLDDNKPARDKSTEAYEKILAMIAENYPKFPVLSSTGRKTASTAQGVYGCLSYHGATPCVWLVKETFTKWLEKANIYSPREIYQDWVSKGWLLDFGSRHYYKKYPLGPISISCCCILLPESANIFDRLKTLGPKATVDMVSWALKGITPSFKISSTETANFVASASSQSDLMAVSFSRISPQKGSILLNPALAKKLNLKDTVTITYIQSESCLLITATAPFKEALSFGLKSTPVGKLLKEADGLFEALTRAANLSIAPNENYIFSAIEVQEVNGTPLAVVSIDPNTPGFIMHTTSPITPTTISPKATGSQINSLLSDEDED